LSGLQRTVNSRQRIGRPGSTAGSRPYDLAMTAPATNEPTQDPEPSSTPATLEVTVKERSDERGQGMVEYAFILVLIAMVVLIALQVLGHSTNTLFSNISNGLTVAAGG
jgi:pilus assembly protein Flp/PilA